MANKQKYCFSYNRHSWRILHSQPKSHSYSNPVDIHDDCACQKKAFISLSWEESRVIRGIEIEEDRRFTRKPVQ